MDSASDVKECHRCEGTGKIYAFVDGHTDDGRPWAAYAADAYAFADAMLAKRGATHG